MCLREISHSVLVVSQHRCPVISRTLPTKLFWLYCKYRQHNPLYPLRVGTIHFFVFSRELKFSNWHRLQNPRFIAFSRKSCRLKRQERFGRYFAKKRNFFPFIVAWKYCYYYFFPLGEKHPFFFTRFKPLNKRKCM